jgi:hypothetical protein
MLRQELQDPFYKTVLSSGEEMRSCMCVDVLGNREDHRCGRRVTVDGAQPRRSVCGVVAGADMSKLRVIGLEDGHGDSASTALARKPSLSLISILWALYPAQVDVVLLTFQLASNGIMNFAKNLSRTQTIY